MDIKAAIGCFLFLTAICHVNADVSHLASSFSSGGNVPVTSDINTRSFQQNNWNIRDNIPGEPGVDYPIYSAPPASSFSCKGRHYGYYADVESRCQVFRVCSNTDLTGKGFAFLCPNGTLFNQKFFVCDWYKNVDCSASEIYFSRNELLGTKMSLMSQNDMMSMVQGMVDYTKQAQVNNQKINNNGAFPFSNSGLPKQLENSQSLNSHNNGLTSIGTAGNSNNNNQQQRSGISHSGAKINTQIPQRGSEILSQPIFPSENNRFSFADNTPGAHVVPKSNSGSTQLPQNDNNNLNDNTVGTNNYNNNYPSPQVFVSSLGEISTDPMLKFNPFTTAIVNTRTFDTLSSNVDTVSTSADLPQKLTSQKQFNHLNDNSAFKSTQLPKNEISKFAPDTINRITFQQEINNLRLNASNNQPLNQQGSAQNQQNLTHHSQDSSTNLNSGSNDQSEQTLTAIYTGSGDLLSQTISQYGHADQSSSVQTSQGAKDPYLSALVNSLGETILTPIFSGEGNLLTQTIGQSTPSQAENDNRQHQHSSTTLAKLVGSTPQPILQVPYYNDQTAGSREIEEVSKFNTAHSGDSNLLGKSNTGTVSQTNQQLGSSQSNDRQHQHSSKTIANLVLSTPQPILQAPYYNDQTAASRETERVSKFKAAHSGDVSQTNQQLGSSQSNLQSVYSGRGKLLIDQRGSKSISNTQTELNTAIGGSKEHITSTGTDRASQGDPTTHMTQLIQSDESQTFGRGEGGFVYSKQPPQPVNQNLETRTMYNNQLSYGQKLVSKSGDTGTTTLPYSPSIPSFTSTTANNIINKQQYQASNAQSHILESPHTQPQPIQSFFSNNQFQVPSKEYLPENTRTARTNEVSFGNHGAAASKLTSSHNYANERFGDNQQDSRQQYTYPIDETDSKLLDNTNELANLGIDADTTKQNLTNRDVTHNNKYLYREQMESVGNDTTEATIVTSEKNLDNQLSSISIEEIFDLNRILQEKRESVDKISEEKETSQGEVNVTEDSNSVLSNLSFNPIIVAPETNSLSEDDDIRESKILKKVDESANLLFAGLQLSLYEQKEILNNDIKNELNEDIFRIQDSYEEKIRNPKDVHSSGGGQKQSNSIKLIFERAKNRSYDFRVKLKKEDEHKMKRTFVIPPKSVEEKLVTILKPLLRNITVTPNKYHENNTKIGGFINNDIKSSITEPRQRHSLAPRILFKNVKTIEDIERIATGIDTTDSENDELASETKLSNRIKLLDYIKERNIYDSDNSTSKTHDRSKKESSPESSIDVVNTGNDGIYYTKTIFASQRNQRRPVNDHETASSNQQNYASTYISSHSRQYNQPGSRTYNQQYPYQQYQQQPPLHFASIDNRPKQSHSSFEAPPLQSNYPTDIQNNPKNSYHSVVNHYIPDVPSVTASVIPQSLPSIVHPSQYPIQPTSSFSSNQSPRARANDKVIVKIIPATGWYLNDANERQSFLDAVSRGLLSDKGFVYVNDVQSSQRQSNLNLQQPQITGRSQIDIDEEAYFRGSTSYESPLNSVGKLAGDSDSVSGYSDSSTSGSSSTGYQYQHPRRSFNV